jgi:hypothetical protein
VVNGHWTIEIEGNEFSLDSDASYVSDYPAELAWAPDSAAFYITQSEATSEINGFHTDIFRVVGLRVEKIADVAPVVTADFEVRHKCVDSYQGKVYSAPPNIAGLKWIDGSSKLLVVAEVVPDCTFGRREYFGAYLLSLADGKIVARFSPKEIAAHWRSTIGVRLKGDLKDLNPQEKMTPP